jgi:UDP-N-acetylglucosamine:LPS N-acetylglucosamine transferase
MKIALVCSHGGHLTEILQVRDAFQDNDVFFITYDDVCAQDFGRVYLTKNIGTSLWRMSVAFLKILLILIRERPSVIVSTGAEIAIPAFYIAWLFTKLRIFKTQLIFIESWTRITMPTKTGRLVYPVTDVFLVQWHQLLEHYGSRASYGGSIL